MDLLFYFLALVVHGSHAAPAISDQPWISSERAQNISNSNSSLQSTYYSDPPRTIPISSPPSIASLSSPTDTSSLLARPNNTSSSSPFTPSPSFILSPSPYSSSPTPTIFITEVATTFEATTTDLPPSSTAIVTMVVTAIVPTPITTIPSFSWSNRTIWTPPPQMTDLSAFNVTYFPSGQQNLHIVDEVPAQFISSVTKSSLNPLNASISATVLQLVYPAKSVNPGSKPEGGADFYANPLDLTGARNVTLEYSVFFPANFNWVKGGKLPGLFGGHTGCSGGASARDCFSTRMMWRSQGAGELYLYAPKNKQTEALCAAVGSVCDASYGFSIGRGAFFFTAGGWTHLRQTVILNTPGQSDGSFTLFVDGRPTINRTDVFYRDVVQQSKKSTPTPKPSTTLAPSATATPRVTAITSDGGSQPAEFIGLFFSTFFGGHGKQYATPTEQYTWFKDFVIARHD